MSKRERRKHDTARQEQARRSTQRRWMLTGLGALGVLIVAAGAAVLLLQSPWLAAHRGQVVGALGLALFAVLLALPIVMEYERHPRHLSGPGKNPEQGAEPWDPRL
jgi:FtsH-binding integral membrane protein